MLKIRLIKKIKKMLFVPEADEKHAVFRGFLHFEGAILQKMWEFGYLTGGFFVIYI